MWVLSAMQNIDQLNKASDRQALLPQSYPLRAHATDTHARVYDT